MVMAFIMLFGLISLIGLPQELFPPISYPQLTIVTIYANAAPEEIETLITKPIEEAVGTVGGIKRVRSISKEGISLVIAEFGWSEDMDFASLKVREKIDLIKERLPRESGEPLVFKYNPFDRPVLTLNVTGKRSPLALRELTRRVIKDELEKVEGVASATISGGLEREILVEVDQPRLYAQNVPIMDVVHGIANANLNYPAGTIKESFYEYLVRTIGEFKHVDEIENIAVKTAVDESKYNGPVEMDQRQISDRANLILLKDVATVKDSYKERTSFARYNGRENISVSVQKQAQSNILQVVTRVKKVLKELQAELPKDIQITIVNDQSKFIKNAINNVRDNAWQGAILAFVVLFIFLRNWITSLIVVIIIPVSILAVFVAMYFNNISINIMSLGGLALGVGMLVDNAIVILENISRHRELGEDPRTASEFGATEVTGALMASTLTTVSVFFPMIFVVGIAGQLFKQIAFTIVYAQLISLFVAMTLVPLLVSKVKAVDTGVKKEGYMDNPYLLKFEKLLKGFLARRRQGFLLTVGLFILMTMGYTVLDKELMPKADQGQFMVKVTLPAGTRLEVTNEVSRRIEDYIISLPQVKDVSVIVGSTLGKGTEDVLQRLGSHEAEIAVTLKPKRKISTRELIHRIEEKVKDFQMDKAKIEYLLSETAFSGTIEQSSPLVVEIKGKEIPLMMKIVGNVKEILLSTRGVYNVKSDMPERSPETRVVVDKDKAALYQLSVVDIAQTAQVALKGYIASEYKDEGQEFDIRVRLREADRDDFKKLGRIQLTTPQGQKVTLAELVKIEQGRGPSEIKRVDQERTILVTANIFRRALKDVIKDIEPKLAKIDAPADYQIKMAGETEDMKESFNSLMSALMLSVILVYMIMAGQFESLIQPFIIMFTIPLSLIGVVFALVISHTSVNVIVMLGVIMLGGIAVNNGIVLIDYMNQLQARGMATYDAIIEASKTRLRPILMTALTSILGLVPMAISHGEGAELSSPLAISVMGGLFVTTFLSLFVIPAIYLSIYEFRVKVIKR